MNWKKFLFCSGDAGSRSSIALLILRVGFGLMMLIGHGWPKVTNFAGTIAVWQEKLGIPPFLSACAIIAEVAGAAALVAGLFTRWSSLFLAITMAVAVIKVKAGDPWFTGPGVASAKEPALMYLVVFIVIFLAGAGKFSLDNKLSGK